MANDDHIAQITKGVAAWNAWRKENPDIRPDLSGANLKGADPEVIIDDLEVAQFIYLLLDREKIRNVINTVTRRGVLLLGRFGDGGLALLQAVAAWLRRPENGGYAQLSYPSLISQERT